MPAQVQAQPRRVEEEQGRNEQYRVRADQQAQAARRENDEREEAKRMAQVRADQAYAERLEQQRQQQLRIERTYENERYTNYRYNVGGIYRETNQYGVDLLRQAVNNGYLEGVRAGQADRQNRWPPSFQNALAYRDADDGYTGNYVGQSDYSYYFREGFERGYEDGYYRRSQYGNYSNGTGSILGDILSSILGLQPVR